MHPGCEALVPFSLRLSLFLQTTTFYRGSYAARLLQSPGVRQRCPEGESVYAERQRPVAGRYQRGRGAKRGQSCAVPRPLT